MKAEVFVPEVANHVPHLRVTWPGGTRASAAGVVSALRDGEPSIVIRSEEDALVIGVWMMRNGEEKVVARRLKEALERKPAAGRP